MTDENIENATLKLADFGMAKALAEVEMTRTMCGSPLYMAPEVMQSRSYDYKVQSLTKPIRRSTFLSYLSCLISDTISNYTYRHFSYLSLSHHTTSYHSNKLRILILYPCDEGGSMECGLRYLPNARG